MLRAEPNILTLTETNKSMGLSVTGSTRLAIHRLDHHKKRVDELWCVKVNSLSHFAAILHNLLVTCLFSVKVAVAVECVPQTSTMVDRLM
jgi:hypothetical protein